MAEEYRGSAAEWDAFVREQAGWTHFHLHGWRDVIRSVFGHDCPYLCVRGDGGALEGVLPLVRVSSALFGHYLISLPFVNYGGPLGSEEGVRELARQASGMARREGVDLLELRSRRELPIDLPVSHRKITVVRDLPPGEPEALWEDLPSKVRSQVRRPRKEGVEIRFGPEELDPFFEVFATHMRNLGTPTQPRELFATIREVFGSDVWFGTAYLDGRPVAVGCGLRWAGEVEMTWASDLFEYRRIAPNMLLYWSFMERAAEEGLSLFNFGRCTPGSGTHRFKEQWGTRDEQLWWYQHEEADVEGTPSPDDGAWAWGPKIWRKIPEPVANALGPKIVQYIP